MTGPGEGSAGGPAPSVRITPLDIQQKEFRVSRFGGYRMRDVDEFLDQLTEVVSGLVEENARLRRQAGAAPVVGSPDLDDVARQADEIIQRARDEAARIAAEARTRSAESGTPAAGNADERAAVKAFLQQERTFLQDLAGLVQGHAETVKGMARGARREEPAAVGTEPPPPTVEDPKERRDDAADGAKELTAADEPAVDEQAVDEEPTERVVEIEDADTTQAMPTADGPAELTRTRPAAQERGAGGDASLRDLFWGEDG